MSWKYIKFDYWRLAYKLVIVLSFIHLEFIFQQPLPDNNMLYV